MNNTAIRVNTLSKCYHIYDRPQDRLKQLIVPKLRSLIGRTPNSYYREFQALNNVSFEVNKGETVGIIGRNGSGKSTLLQIICGTLEPTIGSVDTNGRVAALLELGAGFNPEFTGRENVYLNATVLGLTEEEIKNRFDEIAAFADIGDFIEQPVKHYSSGMYARLAFAVAINVDPSILIVDEALAVGDEPFQRKCFARIEEIKRNGGTILFVSHSSSAIVALCDRAILLNQGNLLFSGKPKTAVSWYQKLMNASEKSSQVIAEISKLTNNPDVDFEEQTLSNIEVSSNKVSTSGSDNIFSSEDQIEIYDPNLISKSIINYEPDGAIIFNPRIETLDGKQANILTNGQKYKVTYEVKFLNVCSNVRFRCMIKTTKGVELGGGTYPSLPGVGLKLHEKQHLKLSFEFFCNLNPGTYFVNCGLSEDFHSLHRVIDALIFKVSELENTHSFGVVDFKFKSTVKIDH
jgi:lipopolysaccharide transport system ATP-binding protein